MARAMVTGTRSEQTAAQVAAEPERKAAPVARGLPDTVLAMQKTAGNAAVSRTVAGAPARAISRCGPGCGCATCGPGHDEELLDEKFGAGLLRSAVARRSA